MQGATKLPAVLFAELTVGRQSRFCAAQFLAYGASLEKLSSVESSL